MAITKIHAIKTSLTKPLDYIMNEEKTQDKLLVSGYRCSPEVAKEDFMFQQAYVNSHSMDKRGIGKCDILAYHMIQSFSKTDEITPEKAHELGEKWAREVTNGNHQFVIATHVDKGHIHNHIIFNSYSPDTLKKFRSEPYKTAQKLRDISDRICEENHLHVLENTRGVGQHYREWQARQDGTSWKEKIESNIERALSDTDITTFADFRASLQGLGVEIDESGKYIKYRIEGQSRWSRANGRSLPITYSYEGIQDRLTESGEKPLHHITLAQKLVKGEEYDSYNTRIPYTNEYVVLDREHCQWYKGGKTLSVHIDPDKTYTIYDREGRDIREVRGAELSTYYDRKDRAKAERAEGAPEREQGAIQAAQEQGREQAHPAIKKHLRGSMAALRGVTMPIGAMAVREMRKYQIDNIQNMAHALRTIKQENIKSYGEFDRRITGYVGETIRLSKNIDLMKKERDGLTANLGALKIYEEHLKYRSAIKNAGILQRKKLSTKYELEIKALEGSEKRLEREGIDPTKVNTAQWNTRIEELTAGIRKLEKEKGNNFNKSQNVREAKKEMERLFIDKGIDYEMRRKQEISLTKQEHKRGRGR